MKRFALMSACMLIWALPTMAQTVGDYENEPTVDELGAPLYPGAVFIRKTPGIDPLYETAMYVSLVPMNLVEDFYRRKLPEKRMVLYDDENTYMTAFLLKTWSKFPGKPKKDSLARLETEPSIQLHHYDPEPFESLIDLLGEKSDTKMKLNVLRNGKTRILFTYEKSEENKSARKIIAAWKEVSRDLPEYYGSVIRFNEDGTYSFTFTKNNLRAMAKRLSRREVFAGMSERKIVSHLSQRNPELGTYSINKNYIAMTTDKPTGVRKRKGGLAHVGSSSLSLRLINLPRLTFLKVPDK